VGVSEMAYHFGRERRKGSDRRVARNRAFAGVERRLVQRRALRRERKGPFAHIIVALIAFIGADIGIWDGYYRDAMARGVNHQADLVRNWSANIWDWESAR